MAVATSAKTHGLREAEHELSPDDIEKALRRDGDFRIIIGRSPKHGDPDGISDPLIDDLVQEYPGGGNVLTR